jgi:hypothetical protein
MPVYQLQHVRKVPCARFELAMSSLRTRWRWPLAQHGMAPPMGIQPTMTRSTGGRLQQPTPRAFEKGCGSGESNPPSATLVLRYEQFDLQLLTTH